MWSLPWSLQRTERSEQKAYAQQVIDFFQEADNGLRLRHDAIDCLEHTPRQAVIVRHKRDGNIRFGIVHAQRRLTTIQF
jgi:hypothetical protein